MKQAILALLLLPQIIVSSDFRESAIPPQEPKKMTTILQRSEPDEEPQGFVGQVCERIEECANLCLVCVVITYGLIATGKNKVR